jgi:hypothetical protein
VPHILTVVYRDESGIPILFRTGRLTVAKRVIAAMVHAAALATLKAVNGNILRFACLNPVVVPNEHLVPPLPTPAYFV